MTAQDLLEKLRADGYGPQVDGYDLVLAKRPPQEMQPVVGILQCSLRALLTGERLFATDANGKPLGTDRSGVIDPREPLPGNAALVCVERSGNWDRISPFARETYPHLFAPVAVLPRRTQAAKAFKAERAR